MKIQPGLYKHYKGKVYKVLGIVRHSETLEELVLYQAQYNSKEFGNKAYWARPLKMFDDVVDCNGKKVRRFERIKQ